MANLNGFDANTVEPADDLEPIPSGKYVAVITDIEVKVDRCIRSVGAADGDRRSCGHGGCSLVRFVGRQSLDDVRGNGKHQRPAVVPVDIDLRPIAYLLLVMLISGVGSLGFYMMCIA